MKLTSYFYNLITVIIKIHNNMYTNIGIPKKYIIIYF